MESLRRGSSFSSASMSELLPAPEGAVTTKSSPFTGSRPRSFDVLHLLAHLLDEELELERALGDLQPGGFRGERVRLAVHLLREEVEPLADRARRPGLRHAERALRLLDMRAEARQLLVDVGARRKKRDLGADALLVAGAERLAQPLFQLRLERGGRLGNERRGLREALGHVGDTAEHDRHQLRAFARARRAK